MNAEPVFEVGPMAIVALPRASMRAVPEPRARMECWMKGSMTRRPTKVVVPQKAAFFSPRLMRSTGMVAVDGGVMIGGKGGERKV